MDGSSGELRRSRVTPGRDLKVVASFAPIKETGFNYQVRLPFSHVSYLDPSLRLSLLRSCRVSCKDRLPKSLRMLIHTASMQHHLATLANRSLAYEPYHVVDTVRFLLHIPSHIP